MSRRSLLSWLGYSCSVLVSDGVGLHSQYIPIHPCPPRCTGLCLIVSGGSVGIAPALSAAFSLRSLSSSFSWSFGMFSFPFFGTVYLVSPSTVG